ncbi:MAG: hypothetical protein NVSMB26_20130 [Beijerinckiaceae bacterium]
MRKNLSDPSAPDSNGPGSSGRDVKAARGPELRAVPRAEVRNESTLDPSVQLGAERDSLLWILRIVRREVNWSDDSPTLRMIDAALARG